MHEHNESLEIEMEQQSNGASLQEIRRAQALLIEQLFSSLTPLDAAIHQIEAVQENLLPLRSEEAEVRDQMGVCSALLEDMGRTQIELRGSKERLQMQLKARETENSDTLLYLALTLQEAEATEHRAVALVQRYGCEHEDARVTLTQLERKKIFLQQQEEQVRQSIVTCTNSLRQDFEKALAAPSAVSLPGTYKGQLNSNLLEVDPYAPPKDISENLRLFRSTLHQDLTPKPPPIEGKPPPPRRTREKKENLQTSIRCMSRHDMPEVLQIEELSFDHAWTEEDFLLCFRPGPRMGMTAEHDNQVVGFVVYELHKSRLHILNFAVHPSFRRRDVGSQMIDRLIRKLPQQRRTHISLEVRERNVIAQRFFQLNGFEAKRVLHNHYENSEEDAYEMGYRLANSNERKTRRDFY